MSMKAEAQRAQVVSDRIGPDDPRYAALVGRGFNKRFAGHTLYFKSNYAALQRVKRRWDPRNVFHHALSIRP